MKVSKNTINKELNLIFSNMSNDIKRENVIKVNEKYNVPIGFVSDIIMCRVDIDERFNDFVIFSIVETIIPDGVYKYFTKEEISNYRNSKYKSKSIKFPIVFDAVKIAEDQYLSSISVKELMKYRDAAFIRYNEKTQRAMTHVVNGDKEYYKITLNKTAVNNIMESYNKGLFIPNTITLNLPEDAEYSYSNGKLRIRKIEYLDIIDGYHRYIAMSKLFNNMFGEFDYNMELRIVAFPESKARQFIWQEDQKTHMKKEVSDSYNQNNIYNQMVDTLNRTSFLSGEIRANGGLIDASKLAKVLKWEFPNINRRESLAAVSIIRNSIEKCCIKNPELSSRKWTDLEIMCMVAQTAYDSGLSKAFTKANYSKLKGV